MLADSLSDQVYAFWKPRAPPGFAVLGDYLTPLSVKTLVISCFEISSWFSVLNMHINCLYMTGISHRLKEFLLSIPTLQESKDPYLLN